MPFCTTVFQQHFSKWISYSLDRILHLVIVNKAMITDSCRSAWCSWVSRHRIISQSNHTFTPLWYLPHIVCCIYLLQSLSVFKLQSKEIGRKLRVVLSSNLVASNVTVVTLIAKFTWVLSAPDGPHVGPMSFAIWEPYESATPSTSYAPTPKPSHKKSVI